MISSAARATALAVWGATVREGESVDLAVSAVVAAGVDQVQRSPGNWSADPPAAALGIPAAGDVPAPAAAVLPILRSGAGRLVLPRVGDLRGLPPGEVALREAAVDAGAAVVFADAGVTIVPGVRTLVYPAAGRPPARDLVTAAEALNEAMVSATSLFADRGLGGVDPVAGQRVRRRHQQAMTLLPPGIPSRAVRVLDRCAQLEAIVAVAADAPSGAVNLFELTIVDDAFRTLLAAAAEARCAATDAAVFELRR